MFSFRFLNPHLVHQQPQTWGAGSEDSICYHGGGGGGGGIHGNNNYDDEPATNDTLCRDLPPNRLRFLGWWYLTPERHFQEWVGFVVVGMLLLILLGPKVQQIALASSSSSSANANNVKTKKEKEDTTATCTTTCTTTCTSTTSALSSSYLTPKQWMIAATVWCYPYVAYTKLSWKGSYYPGRWLMFVAMPVGTLWILSVLFCGTAILVGTTPTAAGGATTAGRRSSSVPVRNLIRFWIMEIWLSFLPSLGLGLVMGLYQGAVSSLRQQYSRGFFASITNGGGGGHDGDNARIAYFCHALYCWLVPIYWILIDGNRNSGGGNNFSMLTASTSSTIRWWQLPLHCALRQLVGTAIAAIYYMGIVTPASIVAGLNVNSLLVGYGGTVNFRLWYVMEWFLQGWVLRFVLGVVEFAIQWWVRLGTTTTNKSK
mmetsp:Transcript_34918/g.39874  ORF Transcript_34918/g.39874 Transcript_34918/m.39874 type:complete len:428 (+) Transcript_34918:54-1337(+)